MNIPRALECLLFVADAPISPDEMAKAIGVPTFEVEEALDKLGGRFHQSSGLQLTRIAGGYQLCTKPEFSEVVTRFLQPKRHKLSRSLMEVLAIVAYQQPVTSAEIDTIRGVTSDYSLRQLMERHLITEVGRKETAGRPILYGTTSQFLHSFHINSVEELPRLAPAAMAVIGREEPLEQPFLPDIVEEVDR